MVTVLPEPDANVPGNAVAPVSAAQLAEEAVCVAFTTPAVPVQVVESAPFIFTETVCRASTGCLKDQSGRCYGTGCHAVNSQVRV